MSARPLGTRYHPVAIYGGSRRVRRSLATVRSLLLKATRLDAAGLVFAGADCRQQAHLAWCRYDVAIRDSITRASTLSASDAESCECCGRRVRPHRAGTVHAIGGGGYVVTCPQCERTAECDDFNPVGPRMLP